METKPAGGVPMPAKQAVCQLNLILLALVYRPILAVLFLERKPTEALLWCW